MVVVVPGYWETPHDSRNRPPWSVYLQQERQEVVMCEGHRGGSNDESRRRFLQLLTAYGVTSAAAGLLTAIVPAPALAAEQEWRSCRKCRTMFFNGYPQ